MYIPSHHAQVDSTPCSKSDTTEDVPILQEQNLPIVWYVKYLI